MHQEENERLMEMHSQSQRELRALAATAGHPSGELGPPLVYGTIPRPPPPGPVVQNPSTAWWGPRPPDLQPPGDDFSASFLCQGHQALQGIALQDWHEALCLAVI